MQSGETRAPSRDYARKEVDVVVWHFNFGRSACAASRRQLIGRCAAFPPLGKHKKHGGMHTYTRVIGTARAHTRSFAVFVHARRSSTCRCLRMRTCVCLVCTDHRESRRDVSRDQYAKTSRHAGSDSQQFTRHRITDDECRKRETLTYI